MVLGKPAILWAIYVISVFLLFAFVSFDQSQNLAAQNKNLTEVNKKVVIIQSASQNEAVKQLDSPSIILSHLTSLIQEIQSNKQIPKQQQQNAIINPSSYQSNPNPFFHQMPSYNPYPQYPNPYTQYPNPYPQYPNPNPQYPNPYPQYPSLKQIPYNPFPQYPFYNQIPAFKPYLQNHSFQQIPNSQGPSFQQMPYSPSSAFMPPAASPTTTTTQHPLIINGMQMPAYNPYLHNPLIHQIPTPYSQLPSQMPYNPSSAYMPLPPTTTTTASSTTPSDADIDDYLQDLEDIEPCIETLEDYEEYVKPGKW